ncbi:MAG TPA: hypothetical protein VLX28_10480, partial [Thermoanaerobaculia bacterium]|nr:hypothetical protein [Thermoanaerobaculia bacterium]
LTDSDHRELLPAQLDEPRQSRTHVRLHAADRVVQRIGLVEVRRERAAKRASFQAATKDGVKVKMWMSLQVNFSPPVH